MKLFFPRLPVDQQSEPLFYLYIFFFFDRKNRFQRLQHRSAIIRLHPCRQRDQLRLDLHPGPGNLQDLLHLREIIVTGLCKPGHISFDLPVASAERYQHFHPRLQLILHALRNAVLKDLIQFFMLYVYDNIRKQSLSPCLS